MRLGYVKKIIITYTIFGAGLGGVLFFNDMRSSEEKSNPYAQTETMKNYKGLSETSRKLERILDLDCNGLMSTSNSFFEMQDVRGDCSRLKRDVANAKERIDYNISEIQKTGEYAANQEYIDNLNRYKFPIGLSLAIATIGAAATFYSVGKKNKKGIDQKLNKEDAYEN